MITPEEYLEKYPMATCVSWDWKEQPEPAEMQTAFREFYTNHIPLRIVDISSDYGSDEYIWMFLPDNNDSHLVDLVDLYDEMMGATEPEKYLYAVPYMYVCNDDLNKEYAAVILVSAETPEEAILRTKQSIRNMDGNDEHTEIWYKDLDNIEGGTIDDDIPEEGYQVGKPVQYPE